MPALKTKNRLQERLDLAPKAVKPKAAKNGEPCAAEVELLVRQYEATAAAAKAKYQEADAIEQKLIGILSGGRSPIEALAAFGRGETKSIPLTDGRMLRLTSKFFYASGEAKTKAFGMAGVMPVEIEVK